MIDSAMNPDSSKNSKNNGETSRPADGVVCFAGVDWWYHNRGHSECQIMTRLCKRVPVLWVNSIGMRVPKPGRTELPIRRYLRKLGSTLKGLRKDKSGMWVYSPIFIPRYTPRAARLNGILLRLQVSLLCRALGIRHPVAFVTVPTACYAVDKGPWSSVIFNRSDDYAAFPEADGDFIRPLESHLLDRSNKVLFVNRLLYEREHKTVRKPYYIGHGVDLDHFLPASTIKSNHDAPTAIRELQRPIVGFYGALDDYTIDLDLMIRVARHVKPGVLLVIGPQAMDIARLLKEPNVIYLGAIPYADLPSYAAQFDVGIMPWLKNEWIEKCNPIKLKEYLAMGFPVVSMRFSELKPYESLVYGADSHDEFVAALDRALQDREIDLSQQRRDAVANDSWDRIAARVGELLKIKGAPEGSPD